MAFLDFDYWWKVIFSDKAVFTQVAVVCVAIGIWLLSKR